MVRSEGGYLVFALVWSNCGGDDCGGLCIIGKMAVWHCFVNGLHGFCCLGSGCRGDGRLGQRCGRVAGCAAAMRVGWRGRGHARRSVKVLVSGGGRREKKREWERGWVGRDG